MTSPPTTAYAGLATPTTTAAAAAPSTKAADRHLVRCSTVPSPRTRAARRTAHRPHSGRARGRGQRKGRPGMIHTGLAGDPSTGWDAMGCCAGTGVLVWGGRAAVIVRATTLAESFTRLKERSGLSYAAISRKCYLSTSSLHRYFTGQGTPSDPNLVIRIAEACGADAAEMRSVLRCWLGQTSGGQPPAAATATPDAPAEALRP
ncbi:helix-turn-helix transcriptional regulator [Streptomyces sp. NPDC047453]|uniref:helix-turn-helix domain-containing protein n=1 Tax=Streptomyces sp. NPDC047453 TaxID=3154812 RepID=UPI0033FFDD12